VRLVGLPLRLLNLTITFPGTVNFTEAFKGQVNNINKNYPVSLGEEHMFDFAMMDTLIFYIWIGNCND